MTTEELVARFIIRSGLQNSWKTEASVAEYAQKKCVDMAKVEQLIQIMNELENQPCGSIEQLFSRMVVN